MPLNAFYIAYTIPIASRWLGNNNFKPGPFHLGPFVSCSPACSWKADLLTTNAELADISDCSDTHDMHEHRLPFPGHSEHECE